MQQIKLKLILLLAALIAVSLARTAVGGPPLLCHSIEVPADQSLPWGSDKFTKSSSYSTSSLIEDTLKLLKPEAPVLVRMETLRRATLYIDKNRSRADELLGRLMARALDAEAAGKAAALAWFDAGYFAQCLYQSGAATSFGPAVTKGVGSSAVQGYSWVARSIELAGPKADPAFEIAAALMTCDSRGPEHEQHMKRALAADITKGSEQERLLAWIAQINGSSLEAIRTKHGLSDARSNG